MIAWEYRVIFVNKHLSLPLHRDWWDRWGINCFWFGMGFGCCGALWMLRYLW